MVKIILTILVPGQPHDAMNAKNPETMFPWRFKHAGTIDVSSNCDVQDSVQRYMEKHKPEYSGTVIVQQVFAGPGRARLKMLHPDNAKGPKKVLKMEV